MRRIEAMKASKTGGGCWIGTAWRAARLGFLALAAAVPLRVSAEGPSFKDNVVVIGSDGQSTLVVQSNAEIVVFRREIDLPATGGFFRRAKVWADRGDLRITSLNGEGLVFLGNERVGTFPIPGAETGNVLFQFSEHGHTLQVVKTGDLPPPEGAGAAAGARLDVRITRP